MTNRPSFFQEYKYWLLGAVLLHALVAVALLLSNFTLPRQVPQQVSVKAELVDESKTNSAKEAVARKEQAERERKAAEERRQREREQQKVDADRKAKMEREQKTKAEADRKAANERDAKLKAENDRKAKLIAEQKAKAEAEKNAQAAADKQAKAEAERKAKAEAEQKARAEAERKAKAEAERQAKLAAEAKAKAAAEAAARREAELMASMEAEEKLLAAQTSGELAQYIALIKQKVERNWAQPAGAVAKIECELYVNQIPGGEVVGVKTGRCNADAAVVRSIEAAVYKSSPLPLPSNPALFERNLRFVFKPEE